jgi:hypothetical protein
MAHITEINVDATGLVIRGYDPVAYFTEGRAIAVKWGQGKIKSPLSATQSGAPAASPLPFCQLTSQFLL